MIEAPTSNLFAVVPTRTWGSKSCSQNETRRRGPSRSRAAWKERGCEIALADLADAAPLTDAPNAVDGHKQRSPSELHGAER